MPADIRGKRVDMCRNMVFASYNKEQICLNPKFYAYEGKLICCKCGKEYTIEELKEINIKARGK